jgi:hypothetical protein
LLYYCTANKTYVHGYCDKKIKEFKTRLPEFRNNFDSFWNEIVRAVPNSYSVKRNRMEPIEGEDKSTYRRLFPESLDVVATNISDRFSDMPKLKFLSMLDHKQFTKFSAEFPLMR